MIAERETEMIANVVSFDGMTPSDLENRSSASIVDLKNHFIKKHEEAINSIEEIDNLQRNLDKSYDNMVIKKVTYALEENGVDLSITKVTIDRHISVYDGPATMIESPIVDIHYHKGESFYNVTIEPSFSDKDVRNVRYSSKNLDKSFINNFNKVLEVVNSFDWSILNVYDPANAEYLPTVPYVNEKLFDKYYHGALNKEFRSANFNKACAYVSSLIGSDACIIAKGSKKICSIVGETDTHYIVKEAEAYKGMIHIPEFDSIPTKNIRKDIFIKSVVHEPFAIKVATHEDIVSKSYIAIFSNGSRLKTRVYKEAGEM